MGEMEERIIELVIRVCVEGAYCCRLSNVRIGDSARAARITMRCERHIGYTFDLDYGGGNENAQQDSVLMRQICKGLVDGQLKRAQRHMNFYTS